ncbi:LysM peptidoglycan-binding domain-containing protein [Odoribacter sp. OF09-27XD]|nr:LysM peptidoglycan-binding domain-containing protein [Odoribacter sp. OF09-27XD]RHV98625.1 LysM peptidoglycan-binding domain-containing protein [Odoribacter sp. OF09-27XD]
MMKFVIVLFVLLACGRLSAQHVEVHKSTDIVVIKGKSYYLHVVEDGQTLYSICKAYGVDINAVKELNGKQDNAISMFEVLKIPYVEPYVEKDGKYYYHKVEKGETLYSISRKFGIKVRQILKENKQYENTPLSIGAIVRLPIKEIDVAQIGTSVDMPVKETEEKVIGLEQTIPLEEKRHEPEEVRKNYYPLVGDTLAGGRSLWMIWQFRIISM